MKRLFLAIPLPHEIKCTIKPLLERLRGIDGDIKVVSGNNLHFTIKFLGEVDEGKIEKIRAMVYFLTKNQKAFSILLKGVGSFPSLEHINTVWIGAESPELVLLMKNSNRISMHLRQEQREEIPHVTIARMGPRKNNKQVQDILTKFSETTFGIMKADKIVLYESVLTPGGPTYTPLGQFEFSHLS